MVKTTVILVRVGASIGAIVASFVVPPALAWYTEPGGLPGGATIPAVVQIPQVIRYATNGLLQGQAIGAAIGGAVGLVLGITIGVRRRRPHKV